jgi:hypothetical protein
MSAIDGFADAIRFVGYTATWIDDVIPVSDADFRERFTLYAYTGWVPGDPIPPPPAPIQKAKYPALATVLDAMRSREAAR